MKPRILLIGHDANRAGAQVVLLQVMQQLHANGFSLVLLLAEAGPLLLDYEAVATVVFWPQQLTQLLGPLPDKLLGKLGLWQRLATQRANQQHADLRETIDPDSLALVLVNTVSAATLFRQLDLPGHVPVLAFLHELAMSVRQYANPDDLRHLLARATRLLTVSRATAHYYETAWQVPPGQIDLFTLLDLPALQQALDTANARPSNLPGLSDLPANALVVGGCGNAEWRKGTDLFVTLARMVIRPDVPEETPIYFIWVGLPPGPMHHDLSLDLAKANLTDRVRLIPPTPDVARYMARFDVFLLCSREDPYPLVVLEAGLSGVPVVCFAGAGGATELVETDGGAVVPYLDLTAAAAALHHLLTHQTLRREQGQTLRRKIQQRHSLSRSTSQLLALVNTYSRTILR